MNKVTRNGVVYSYNGPGLPTWDAVSRGRAPRERLFGAFQLQSRGVPIEICDDQWSGRFASLRRRLPSLFEFPSRGLLKAMRRNQCVVVQGRIAPLIQLAAWALGCGLVYIDVMFGLPRRTAVALIVGACLRRADAIISYSRTQNSTWVRRFKIDAEKITAANYPMDSTFYEEELEPHSSRTQLLAVGRDPGRDFQTLVSASREARIPLTMVTLDYLIPANTQDVDHIRILQRLEYHELFAEYAKSIAAIVPLKPGVDYPSGIRAVLEAMLIGVPVIATRTPVLEEHFGDEEHILFVPPNDHTAIVAAVSRLRENPQLSARLSANARAVVVQKFGVEQFADTAQAVFHRLLAT